MQDEPVLEILMATYNGEAFLREQIDSILAQDDQGWHLTISDDGSDDDTVIIIESYAKRYPDKITFYRSGRRFGNARDHFLHLMNEATSAEWMLFCDQDDYWWAHKVRKMRTAINGVRRRYGPRKPVLIFSDQVVTDEKLKPTILSLTQYQKHYVKEFDYRSILMQNVVTGGAMAVNRPLAELAAEAAGTSKIIMHDWWLAAVAARFGKIVYLELALGYYRQHGNNAVGAKHVGSFGYFRNRVGALKDVKRTIQQKKEQAGLFLDTYRDRLEDADFEFLNGFTKRRSGPFFFLKYRKLLHGKERKIGMTLLG
ncbi:MAG: glycosyltransferase family 2 protein [Lachnospiraceae bacterium]|nr:glycosyltransferase family 2 protein [Lachnospiraceae bacterium]